MVIHKMIQHGSAWGVNFPAAFVQAVGLHPRDLVSIELGRNDEIIIKRVDLKALAEMRKQNAKNRK